MNNIFELFSSTCVHNPFEVIIVILSLCISLLLISCSNTSLNLVANENTLSSNFKNLNDVSNDQSFTATNETVILLDFNFSFIMLLRMLAFVCIFVQFKSLKRIHSRFILGKLKSPVNLFC